MCSTVRFRPAILFFVALSLGGLVGMSGAPRFPQVPLARAVQTLGSQWFPSGPSMSTLFIDDFSNLATEYDAISNPNQPTLDFADGPLPQGFCCQPGSSFGPTGQPNLGTTPQYWLGFNEIEFNLGNTMWGCNFSFGNSLCGINIRQGIAHMIDRYNFALNDPYISGGGNVAAPIDNPLPTGSSLYTPNSCGWDTLFPETASCFVGSESPGSQYTGGNAYRLGQSSGAGGFSWLQAPGSLDLDAAAAHFVQAGLASGCDGKTGVGSCTKSKDSILSGITAPQCSTTGKCTFYIRNDVPALDDLGTGIAEAICYLFTGTFSANCNYLSAIPIGGNAFPGFYGTTDWFMYTAGAGTYVPMDIFSDFGTHTGDILCNLAPAGCDPFDLSLYYAFNSRFINGISGINGNGFCSSASFPSKNPANYMWLCSPNYDSMSLSVENSSCVSANGDPVLGASSNLPTSPGNGLCGNGALSADSAGIQAENTFGQGAYTIPVYTLSQSYGYLICSNSNSNGCSSNNSWTRIVSPGGTFNDYNFLNAYSPQPVQPGTIRQGYSTPTHSLSPFVAAIPQDFGILNGVYNSLYIGDPYNDLQYVNWMTENTQVLTSVSYNSGGVTTAPPRTAVTYRFTLFPSVTFQDASPVTSYDVAFSYLSLVASGSVVGGGLSHITGITILSPTLFDIGVDSTGLFVLPSITSFPILPGSYWTNACPKADGLSNTGSRCGTWDSALSVCENSNCADAQLTPTNTTIPNCTGACQISTFPQPTPLSLLETVNPNYLSASFDPIRNHLFIGSGPWQCGAGSGLGQNCYTGFGGNGANTYTLTANSNYFRSSLRLGVYLWSEESDTNAIGPANAVGSCYNVAVNLAGPCGHWQQGLGNENGGSSSCCRVSITTVGNVDVFFNVNWVSPFEWATSPPTDIAPLPPVLYGLASFDGLTTYTPNPGGSSCTTANTYYDC